MAALPPPVSRLLEAANAHDTGSFLAAFTDDGVVDDWRREFAGPEGIRGWSDSEFIGVAVSLSVTEADVTDDEATILAEVGGDGDSRGVGSRVVAASGNASALGFGSGSAGLRASVMTGR